MSKNYELLRNVGSNNVGGSPQLTLPALRQQNRQRKEAAEIAILRQETNESEWKRILNILRRRWQHSAIVAVAILLTAFLAAFVPKPLYEPSAVIEIDPVTTDFGVKEIGGSQSDSPEYLETQAKKLQSDELLIAVIRKLHLERSSEAVGDGGLFAPLASLVKRLEARDGSRVITDPEVRNVPALSRPENVALRSVRSHLKVERDTSSRLITVKFSSHDPALAALVTNTIVNAFIEKGYTTRHDAAAESSVWLSKQLDDVQDGMQNSNKALADYERQWGIADLGDGEKQESTFTQKIAELNRQVADAQADRIQLEAYVNGIREGNETALQQVSADPVVQNLTQKHADVRAALSKTGVVYGKNHPEVKKLQNEAAELESQIEMQRTAIVRRIRNSYAAAQTREELLSREMKAAMDQASHMGQYNTLRKQAEANRALYNTLYSRVKEAEIAAESGVGNIRVVDEARILDRPTRPQRWLIVLAGLVLAPLGAGTYALLRDNFDMTVRNPGDIRRSTGLSGVSIMPTFELKGGLKSILKPIFAHNYDGNHAGAERFVFERPWSPEAEALRSLQTSIVFGGLSSNPPQVLQIVSAFQGEGKTTIALNLALALSRHGKTCLVDADLRRPGITSSFAELSPSVGLGEVLAGSVRLEDALLRVPDLDDLTLLPARVYSGDLGKLFTPSSMQDTVSGLRQQFQYVIIDSPPIIAYADGRAIAPFADGLVLVGRYGVTTRDAMAQTIELLSHINAAPILEVVLNAVRHDSAANPYYYANLS